jgi:hypothetical protein
MDVRWHGERGLHGLDGRRHGERGLRGLGGRRRNERGLRGWMDGGAASVTRRTATRQARLARPTWSSASASRRTSCTRTWHLRRSIEQEPPAPMSELEEASCSAGATDPAPGCRRLRRNPNARRRRGGMGGGSRTSSATASDQRRRRRVVVRCICAACAEESRPASASPWRAAYSCLGGRRASAREQRRPRPGRQRGRASATSSPMAAVETSGFLPTAKS